MKTPEEMAIGLENKFKDMLHSRISEIIEKQSTLISEVQKNGRFMNSYMDVPNIGITLNNKIVELQHEFKNAGLSMYSRLDKRYEIAEIPIIGSAIISDLISYVADASEELMKYNEKVRKSITEKIEQFRTVENSNPLKKSFSKISGLFKPVKTDFVVYTKAEINDINKSLNNYISINDELFEYNLRDNIISSIAKEIKERKYGIHTIPDLLEESVNSDLDKLGLHDLIPELKEAVLGECRYNLRMYESKSTQDLDLDKDDEER